MTDNRWYAVQESANDGWDNGSYDRDEAIAMLREQGHGMIAVIDNSTANPVCIKEISFEEVLAATEQKETQIAKAMILADELREMIALGWTDEEAHADTDAFFERIGDAAEGLAEETIWSVWKNVLEIVQEEQNENQKNL